MDRQQAEQEVALVTVRMETDSLEVSHRAKGSHDRIKCTAAFVAGLTVALAVGVILHYFIFPPSHNQVRKISYHSQKIFHINDVSSLVNSLVFIMYSTCRMLQRRAAAPGLTNYKVSGIQISVASKINFLADVNVQVC